MKQYKAKDPAQTIQDIRTILNNNGLFLKEISYANSDYFHSCRVVLVSNNLQKLNIGTGGKGMSVEYSLASAYAEFMERLQNGFLFFGQQYALQKSDKYEAESSFAKLLERKDLTLKFIYDSNEKNIPIEQSVHENIDFYLSLFPFIENEKDAISFLRDDLNFTTTISIPFFSLEKKEEIYLPIEIIHIACGSNGMASGNTKSEALIQGFCEIFERYVGREIYYQNLTPPDIPLEAFKGRRIYETIQSFIQETNYNVLIKDCSLGKGIPVLGVLIIDKERKKYNFNLGSSLSPEIALERCFTEIFQNPIGIYWLDIVLDTFSHNVNYTDEFIYVNGNLIFNNSTGYWPLSLFSSNASYPFNGLNFNLNKSDNEDMEFITKKISALNYQIYIRDISYLGFPAYYIVVPGMSEYPNSKAHYTLFGESMLSLQKIRHIKRLSESEIIHICNNVNRDYPYLSKIGYKISDTLLYNIEYDLNTLDLELLLFMLNYRIGNFHKALFYITTFLDGKDSYSYIYYFAIKDYVDLKLKDLSDDEIYSILKNIYGKELSDEIMSDISDNTKVFDNYDWPNCFDCENCAVYDKCKFFDALSIIKQLQNKQKLYEVNYDTFL